MLTAVGIFVLALASTGIVTIIGGAMLNKPLSKKPSATWASSKFSRFLKGSPASNRAIVNTTAGQFEADTLLLSIYAGPVAQRDKR